MDEQNSVIEAPNTSIAVDTELPTPTISAGDNYSEKAKEIVGALATQNAIKDERLVDEITDLKKDELKANAEANLKEEQAKSKEADKTLQRANYGVFEGVAQYAGVKRPLPDKMQKVLFFMLSIWQTILLFFMGIVTSIVTIISDCAEAVFIKLSAITKAARIFVIGIVCVGAISLAVVIVLHYLKQFGIII